MSTQCYDCFRIGTQCDYHYANGGGPFHRALRDYLVFDDDPDDGGGYADGGAEGDRDEYEPGGSYWEDREDTPSLADTDPEGHRYITNNGGMGY